MRKWAWPAVAFFAVGALGGFIAGTEYGRRVESSIPEDITGSLVGAMMDTLGERVSSAAAKTYEAEMKSNLRNLTVAQTLYFREHQTYGSSLQQIDARIASSVQIVLTQVSATGYRATASHNGLPNMRCHSAVGSAIIATDEWGDGIPWCEDRRR